LHGRDAFLLLHALFDFTDSVVLLYIKFDFAAGESADSITSNISDCIGGYRQVLLLDEHDEIWLLVSGTGCLEVITALALKVDNRIKSLNVKFIVRQYGELMDDMIIKVNGGRLPWRVEPPASRTGPHPIVSHKLTTDLGIIQTATLQNIHTHVSTVEEMLLPFPRLLATVLYSKKCGDW
jgi:hypothetical protein